MTPVESYYLACFTMTVLWFMLVLGATAAFFCPFAVWIGPTGRKRTASEDRTLWLGATWGFVCVVVAIPSLRVLYAFWGAW